MKKKRKPREVSASTAFDVALAAAEKKLLKLGEERIILAGKLGRLDVEIPGLVATITALKRQLGTPVASGVSNLTAAIEAEAALDRARIARTLPPEIASNMPVDNLSGMGSIPPPRDKPLEPQYEGDGEDLLPPIEGEPLTPEDFLKK